MPCHKPGAAVRLLVLRTHLAEGNHHVPPGQNRVPVYVGKMAAAARHAWVNDEDP